MLNSNSILATLLLLLMIGCGSPDNSPKIDGTSNESFEKSIQAIKNQVSERRFSQLGKAIATIIKLEELKAEQKGQKINDEFKRKLLHNKSVNQLFSQGKSDKTELQNLLKELKGSPKRD